MVERNAICLDYNRKLPKTAETDEGNFYDFPILFFSKQQKNSASCSLHSTGIPKIITEKSNNLPGEI